MLTAQVTFATIVRSTPTRIRLTTTAMDWATRATLAWAMSSTMPMTMVCAAVSITVR